MAKLSTSACLTTEDALEFAQGSLLAEDVAIVEAHIDTCEACRDLVTAAVRGLNPGPLAASDTGITAFKQGAVVGARFEIRRFVARGGMGEVYEARDRELETTVALKTVATVASDNERAVRSLKTEVLHARRISHPNVCRIYEWGTHADSDSTTKIHFFTMEFVHGERLGARLRREGPLPVEQALELARQLLSGLAAAHAAGVLHRDFKSDNVMLGEAEGKPKAVILDFGLARQLEGGSGSSSFGPVGTKAYMAPEQLEGEPLRETADLYAFGVVLFEVLTGRRPFEAEDGTERPLACLRKTPVPPGRFVPQIPSGLDHFVLRCLRRAPEHRFQTAQEALTALDALTRPAKPRREAAARLRWAAILPVAMSVALVLAGAGYATFSGAPTVNRNSPVADPVPPIRVPPNVPFGGEAVAQIGAAKPSESAAPVQAAPSASTRAVPPRPRRQRATPIAGDSRTARSDVPTSVPAPSASAVDPEWEPFDPPAGDAGGEQLAPVPSAREHAELKP